PVVVLIESDGFRDIEKCPTAIVRQFIAEEEVGRAVLRVVIRGWIAILVTIAKERIGAQIKIYAAVPIIIGRRHSGEPALRCSAKAERMRPVCESVFALVDEEHWAVRAKH